MYTLLYEILGLQCWLMRCWQVCYVHTYPCMRSLVSSAGWWDADRYVMYTLTLVWDPWSPVLADEMLTGMLCTHSPLYVILGLQCWLMRCWQVCYVHTHSCMRSLVSSAGWWDADRYVMYTLTLVCDPWSPVLADEMLTGMLCPHSLLYEILGLQCWLMRCWQVCYVHTHSCMRSLVSSAGWWDADRCVMYTLTLVWDPWSPVLADEMLTGVLCTHLPLYEILGLQCWLMRCWQVCYVHTYPCMRSLVSSAGWWDADRYVMYTLTLVWDPWSLVLADEMLTGMLCTHSPLYEILGLQCWLMRCWQVCYVHTYPCMRSLVSSAGWWDADRYVMSTLTLVWDPWSPVLADEMLIGMLCPHSLLYEILGLQCWLMRCWQVCYVHTYPCMRSLVSSAGWWDADRYVMYTLTLVWDPWSPVLADEMLTGMLCTHLPLYEILGLQCWLMRCWQVCYVHTYPCMRSLVSSAGWWDADRYVMYTLTLVWDPWSPVLADEMLTGMLCTHSPLYEILGLQCWLMRCWQVCYVHTHPCMRSLVSSAGWWDADRYVMYTLTLVWDPWSPVLTDEMLTGMLCPHSLLYEILGLQCWLMRCWQVCYVHTHPCMGSLVSSAGWWDADRYVMYTLTLVWDPWSPVLADEMLTGMLCTHLPLYEILGLQCWLMRCWQVCFVHTYPCMRSLVSSAGWWDADRYVMYTLTLVWDPWSPVLADEMLTGMLCTHLPLYEILGL